MQRTTFSRIDPKRRAEIDPKKRQFAAPKWQQAEYKHRLNFYGLPPTQEITLEEFEEWAIARLKVLSELETCSFRNRSPEETQSYMAPILEKHLPLHSNTSRSSMLDAERKKDHYSHFILRLAFSATEDLRRRFARLETMLFRLRWKEDDAREKKEFVESLDMGGEWERVGEEERRELAGQLSAVAANGGWGRKGAEEEGWFKVDWEKVPELVEQRKVLLKWGKAYVPVREQMSLVIAEFTRRLEDALELTARALPRLDEDDRLSPILTHLSQSFTAPDSTYDEATTIAGLDNPTASSIDALSSHFPLCMQHLHRTLRANSHLKHFGRLQYTLFLKGLGLSLEECLIFWRRSFKLITDDKFNKEYRYNVRHAYGDVGGDANRRGRGYSPYSCQKLTTEPLPGPGQSHGCPYRTFTPDNLIGLLQQTGIGDRDVLKEVREDVKRQRYHIACNRVFEHAHRREIKKVKDEGIWGQQDLDTIVHPNDWFKRSFLLGHLGEEGGKALARGVVEG
ncbi:DNA primase, large subunit [Saccharata proteae CBS 121410]|uniref:DNA primase large subunit n=1 Tax=Saccharata proteae CBS 121410 TaxID=1314787 RepID=A0A6A5YCQ5_9PEZI|nr:DNA primase, large subunit [Saccharata proteae CBS 121410]